MVSEASLAGALSNKRFELIILPTEKCNFRCTYCYEDFQIGRMSRSTIDGVKRLIEYRAEEVEDLTVSWFGGEPLLAPDVVREIGGHAHSVCSARGIAFHGALTTNAYVLNDRLFAELMAMGHNSYQITLDGDRDWHDRTRLLANQKGTFDVIWANLLSAQRHPGHFTITLRLHVHAENIESVRSLYGKVKSQFGGDGRFETFFHKISNLSGEKGIPQQELDYHGYREALAYITGSRSVDEQVNADVTLSDYICYAARPNSLLVRADGRIGKCTVALNDPRNDVGRLLDDGTLQLDQNRLRRWFEGYRDMHAQTLSCPLSTLSA
ncbi:MAG TPA: radical SAM protein [Stenotrophomonas sp.]|nr:radical SAM protein [Stenotrophomonas sp.]